MSAAADALLGRLRALADPRAVRGMARFGIDPRNAYGVSIPVLRRMARGTGMNHALARRLWASKVHEARILASLIDDPRMVTRDQMDRWARDFDSWDVCDQVCANLFDRTAFAYEAAVTWARRKEEFVKRAGFVLMAVLAVHDKGASDATFEGFFPPIKKGASDGRNFVKKAVNWALRQIGKRNETLRGRALALADEILTLPHPSARWIARDAIRELKSVRRRRR